MALPELSEPGRAGAEIVALVLTGVGTWLATRRQFRAQQQQERERPGWPGCPLGKSCLMPLGDRVRDLERKAEAEAAARREAFLRVESGIAELTRTSTDLLTRLSRIEGMLAREREQ